MIKQSTYIRKFSTAQRKQLESVAVEQGLKTVPEILFFTLENYIEQRKEIERLKRIIQYKQNKIDNLNNQIKN